MLELLYWNTQLMLLIGELAVMLLAIVLPPLWAIGAILEFINRIRLHKYQKSVFSKKGDK